MNRVKEMGKRTMGRENEKSFKNYFPGFFNSAADSSYWARRIFEIAKAHFPRIKYGIVER